MIGDNRMLIKVIQTQMFIFGLFYLSFFLFVVIFSQFITFLRRQSAYDSHLISYWLRLCSCSENSNNLGQSILAWDSLSVYTNVRTLHKKVNNYEGRTILAQQSPTLECSFFCWHLQFFPTVAKHQQLMRAFGQLVFLSLWIWIETELTWDCEYNEKQIINLKLVDPVLLALR